MERSFPAFFLGLGFRVFITLFAGSVPLFVSNKAFSGIYKGLFFRVLRRNFWQCFAGLLIGFSQRRFSILSGGSCDKDAKLALF